MPRNQAQRMIFALITVLITVRQHGRLVQQIQRSSEAALLHAADIASLAHDRVARQALGVRDLQFAVNCLQNSAVSISTNSRITTRPKIAGRRFRPLIPIIHR